MATAKKNVTELLSGESLEIRIEKEYKAYVLNEGKRPPSVFKFCNDLGITEETFYQHYGSFIGLERKIWKKFLDRTVTKLKTDDAFATFPAKEKLLTFYYALFEDLKSDRSFILKQLEDQRKLDVAPAYLKDFRAGYETFVEGILNEGKQSGDIAKRPYIEKTYSKLFWVHLGFLLLFWRDDESADFEKTDAAIEKSVQLAFEFIGKGAFETVIDFAKFLYQSKVK